MNKLYTLLFLLISLINYSQVISSPSIKKAMNHSLNINSIKKTKNATEINFTHKATVAYEKGGWIYIGGGIKLVDTVNKLTYKLISFTGIDTSGSNRHFYENINDTLSFTLVFEPLKKETKFIDIIECEQYNCFNFFGVSLGKKIPVEIVTNRIKESYRGLTVKNEKIAYAENVFVFSNNRLYGFTIKKADGSKEKFTPIDKAVYNVNNNGVSIIEYPVQGEKGDRFVFSLIGNEQIVFSYADKDLEFSK